MKIIITGASGFIGSEVLLQCLRDQRIKSIIALLRRKLPDYDSPKLKQVIMQDDDFLNYPEHVIKELTGAEACIWCLGAVSYPNDGAMYRVRVDYMVSGAKALAAAAEAGGMKMKLVMMSGVLVITDQEQSAWFAEKRRKVPGLGLLKVMEIIEERPEHLTLTCAKPAFVLAKSNRWAGLVQMTGWSIRVDELAAALIDMAVKGSDKLDVENAELREKGAELLRK